MFVIGSEEKTPQVVPSKKWWQQLWPQPELTDSQSKGWDIRLKIVSALITLAVAIPAFLNYIHALEKDSQARQDEASKPFREKQLHMLLDLSGTAARLAADQQDAKGKRVDFLHFEGLYWGEVQLLAGDNIKYLAEQYHSLLLGQGYPSPTFDKPSEKAAFRNKLKQKSVEIAEAARTEIEISWRIDKTSK